MCVFGLVRSGQRDESKGNRGACGCSAGRIDKAGCVVPSLLFFIGIIKKNRLCIKESLII